MQERRILQRFSLEAPTIIEVELAYGKNSIFNLATKDISSAGAYVATTEPLPEGQAVKLELLLSLDALRNYVGTGGRTKVRLRGKVIRSERSGMAILFQNKYKMFAPSSVRGF